MSAATLTRPTVPTALAGGCAPPRSGWITLSEAARILGRNPNAIKSAALAGAIGYKSLLGARTLYSRADCERLAAEG